MDAAPAGVQGPHDGLAPQYHADFLNSRTMMLRRIPSLTTNSAGMSISDNSKLSPSLGRRKRSSPFLLIAAGLLIFAAIVGAAFLLSRPATLRIAVGPAGSEDQKLVQALAQTFINEGSPVRLNVISTAGSVESLGLLGAGETDLAVGRADEDMPKGAGSVAILRKNVVVIWAPSGTPHKGTKKESKSKIKEMSDLDGRRIGVIGRTPVNVTLLRVILTESGLNPDKVSISRFSTSQIAEMARDPSTAGSPPRRSPPPHGCAVSRPLSPSMSPKRSPRNIRCTRPRKSPAARLRPRPPDPTTRWTPSASII